MTKTLTEQYKNKELSGWYYVKTKDGSINHWLLFTDTIEFEKDIEEVLAPVPSYEKNNELVQKMHILKKQLEVALEVFGIIAMHSKDPIDAVQAACAISQIKEMEGVK